MDLLEQPWWLGIAPLLGWLLDAVVRTGSLAGAFDRQSVLRAERLEFALRTGMSSQLKDAGVILTVWLAVLGGGLAWAVASAGIVFGGPVGRFLATTLFFYAIFDTRGVASRGLALEHALLEGRNDDAAATLRSGGLVPPGPEPTVLAGSGVHAVSDGLMMRVLTPLFWGLVIGPVGGGIAYGVVAVARRSIASEEEDQTLWHWPLKLADAVMWPAAWLGSFALQIVAPLAGARRGAFFNAFIHRPGLRPHERLRQGFVGGFALDEDAGGVRDAHPPQPSHIQRAVVLMWTGAFVLLAVGTALRCGALHVL